MVIREKRFIDVHLRITPEAYRALWSLATASGRTLGGVVEDLVLNAFSMPVERCPEVYDLVKVIEAAFDRFYNAVRYREFGGDICMPEKSRGEFHYWFCRLFVLYLYGYMHDILMRIEDGRIKVSDILDVIESEFGDPDRWRNLVESARITVRKLSPLLSSRYRALMTKCGSSQSGTNPSTGSNEKAEVPKEEVDRVLSELFKRLGIG